MKKEKELWGFSISMWAQCAILYIAVWCSLFVHTYALLLIAGCTVLTAFFGKTRSVYYQLFFMLPFTVVYKLSPQATSLFAYVMLAVGCILTFRIHKIGRKQLVLIMVFAVYVITGMGSNYTTAAKLIIGLLLLYFFVNTTKEEDFKNQIFAFTLGLLGSSVIGLFKESWPGLEAYFDSIDTIFVDGVRTMRFSGLYYDPNYYSVSVVLAVFLCIVLLLRHSTNRIALGGSIVALLLFGFLSYSKMFFLVILLLTAIVSLHQAKSPKRMISLIIGLAIVLGVFYAWASDSGYLLTIIERFESGDLTTGRADLWKEYTQYILDRPITLLFGEGLDITYFLESVPHNTYLEMICCMGIIGTSVFIASLASIVKHNRYLQKRGWFDYGLCGLFMLMAMALNLLTINDFPFYIMLLWMSLNIRK